MWMRLMLLLGAGLVAAAVLVWRTQHGPEVWHTLPDPASDAP